MSNRRATFAIVRPLPRVARVSALRFEGPPSLFLRARTRPTSVHSWESTLACGGASVDARTAMKNLSSLLLFSMVFVATACKGMVYRADVGPMVMVAKGPVALQNAAGSLALGQNQVDTHKELGLGEANVAPYVRLQGDKDVHRVRLHGFGFSQTGTGTLQHDYGGLVNGSQITSSEQFYSVAANYSYQLARGNHYRIGAGAQLGYYELDVRARSTAGRESVSANVLVPMPYIDAEFMWGTLSFGANMGFMSIDVRDADGQYWDIEGYVRWQTTRKLDLMAGYRYIVLDSFGNATGRDFDADVDLQGLFLTIGVKF